MCSGRRVRGKTTTGNGNSGIVRGDMVPLWDNPVSAGRLKPALALRRAISSMRMDSKVALITGASEGIGAACAAEFARAGARLSLTARSEVGLRQAGGPDALVTPGDLTAESTRRLAVERTVEKFGGVDILINNAGVGF